MFSTNFLFGRKNEGNRSQTAVGGWAVRSGAVLGGQWEVGGGWSIASAVGEGGGSFEQTNTQLQLQLCLSLLVAVRTANKTSYFNPPPTSAAPPLLPPSPLDPFTRWLLLSHLHSAQLCPIPFAPTAFDRSRAIVCVNKHFTIQHKLFLVLVIVVVVMLLPSMLE